MADSGKTYLFVSIVVFWTLLTVFSNVFDVVLTYEYEQLEPKDINTIEEVLSNMKNQMVSGFFDTIDSIPVLKLFSPILKVMSFQFTDQIPTLVSLMLTMVSIFSAYVSIDILRGS